MSKLPETKLQALGELLRFIMAGDYSTTAKRHARGLLLALLGL